MARCLEDALSRTRLSEQFLEIAFQRRALDGLAVSVASAVVAEIVGIVLPTPLSPAGGEAGAASAGHEPAQHEIRTHVGASRSALFSIEAIKDLMVHFDADQRLMHALADGDAPIGGADQTRVCLPAQHLGDARIVDAPFAISRKFREALKEALHFRLTFEAPGRIAFQGFLDDRSEGLLWKQQAAAALDGAILVANWRRGDGVASFDPRHHLLNGLPAKLLPLQLAAGDGDGFVVAAFWRVLEAEIRAVDDGAEVREAVAQLPVEARASCETLQVIEDDDVVFVAIGFEVFEHADHAGALHVITIAGLAVGVDGFDRDTEFRSMIAAQMFLAAIAVAVELLLFARHAAIDYGGVHGLHLFSSQSGHLARRASLALRLT